MALFHIATVTPTKADMIATWVPEQPWGPDQGVPIEWVGGYRFDDPDGRVGMECHIATAEGVHYHVPVTYRDEPVDGLSDALICEMEHTVLGTRWVYDGLHDPVLTTMLAAATMTGQGEALGMVEHDGRWVIAPSPIRINGGGWPIERVPVDRFELRHEAGADMANAVVENERFRLSVARRPSEQERPPIALTATWAAQPTPVLLASVVEV